MTQSQTASVAKHPTPANTQGVLRVRVTGLAPKEFADDLLAEKLGDYFYSRNCEVVDLEVLSDAVLMTLSNERSMRQALSLNGRFDTGVAAAWERPHGRIVCNSTGFIVKCCPAQNSHSPSDQKCTSKPSVDTCASVPPRKQKLAATSKAKPCIPCDSFRTDEKFASDGKTRQSTQMQVKSSNEKCVSGTHPTSARKPLALKPRPWDPCEKRVVVQSLQGIKDSELCSMLLGLDDVNYKFLQSFTNCVVSFDRHSMQFEIRARHQSAMMDMEDLIADLCDHIKETVQQQISARAATLCERVSQYNELASDGWKVPVSVAPSTATSASESKSDQKIDEISEGSTLGSEEVSDVESTCNSEGSVQVEKMAWKDRSWKCGCGVMNFTPHGLKCQWCDALRLRHDV